MILIECNIGRQRVITTSQARRLGGKYRELPVDVEPTTQHGQIVGVLNIASRHALSDGIDQLLGEQSYQDFEQRLALPIQRRDLARFDFQVQSDGDHVDKAAANAAGYRGALLTREVDLGQDFERTAFGGNHANDPPRAKFLAAVIEYTAAAPTGERRCCRYCGDAICGRLRDFIGCLAVAYRFPLQNGATDHRAANSS
jgi:hypothetical protein